MCVCVWSDLQRELCRIRSHRADGQVLPDVKLLPTRYRLNAALSLPAHFLCERRQRATERPTRSRKRRKETQDAAIIAAIVARRH